MKGTILACTLVIVARTGGLAGEATPPWPFIVAHAEGASFAERLAAHEVRRYLYARTGTAVPIVAVRDALPPGRQGIVVTAKDQPLAKAIGAGGDVATAIAALGPQEYLLRTIARDDGSFALVAGGDPIGTLYGAYRLAERLGVRFSLHGDTIPDERIALAVPEVDERGKPLFALRGIQPFHDFPEGPDWWNLDDYRAILSQLPKLRMNFFGLHTYPEGGPNAEPTVWIGLPGDVAADGDVAFAYPSSYQNTLRGNWGYEAKKTGDFALGASQLFEQDAYGSEVMIGHCPEPRGEEACREVFRRTASMLRAAFEHARDLGIKTCAGTETRLTVPRLVAERLKGLGKDPASPSAIQELYEGIFLRASRAYHLDYYWFWTPEGWTWEAVKPETVRAVIGDMTRAIAAAKRVDSPFELATCGWVLGPQDDRALFDKIFPLEMPLSCINRMVGKEAVDAGFARCKRPHRWAIPWLEDDPALTVPQLWVGRMREDAADALAYGCDGLMGIHWRTRVLGPNVLALAWAAWDQGGWGRRRAADAATAPRREGPTGGATAAFPNNAIAGTDDDPIYQTVRYNVDAYRLAVANGTYRVTLKFCEPHYGEAGRRVFGVKLQGRPAIERLDIFEVAGKDKALDRTFEGVKVTDGFLTIDFVKIVEFPSIAGIVVEGGAATRKINCGGPAYRDFAADWTPEPPRPRGVPSEDFFRDWARHEFGEAATADIAAELAAVDNRLPCPADWVNGPGGINPDPRPWETVAREYDFVDRIARAGEKIVGAGNRERFDYWNNTFQYLRAVGRVRCTWARYNEAIAKAKAEKDEGARAQAAGAAALPLRIELVRDVAAAYRFLLAHAGNMGELGTIANWEQHIIPGLLRRPGEELAKILGRSLPPEANLPEAYDGPPRVIVPTMRGSRTAGEALTIRVLVLAARPPERAELLWRASLGAGEFAHVPLAHVARGVYTARFPPEGAAAAAGAEDLEYYVEASFPGGAIVRHPAQAPAIGQTVVTVSPQR